MEIYWTQHPGGLGRIRQTSVSPLAKVVAWLTKLHHDLGELRGIVAPITQKAGCVLKRNDDADSVVDGEALGFEHADDLAEVIG
jgi:hypothetical protein